MNAFPDSLVHPVTFRCTWKQTINYTIFVYIYASILHNIFKNNTLKLLMKLALSEHHDEVFTYVDNPYATHICNVDYVPAQHTMAVRRIQLPMAIWPRIMAQYCHWAAVDYAWNISLIECITITQIRQVIPCTSLYIMPSGDVGISCPVQRTKRYASNQHGLTFMWRQQLFK